MALSDIPFNKLNNFAKKGYGIEKCASQPNAGERKNPLNAFFLVYIIHELKHRLNLYQIISMYIVETIWWHCVKIM